MPPASAVRGTLPHQNRDLNLGLQLGTEYQRRKQKLQQELQLDFRQHVSQIKDVKTNEPRAQPEGLSLPIDDKISVKEKLREERNKEYNIFLQKQAQIKRFNRGASRVSFAPGEVQPSSTVNIPNSTPSHRNVSAPSNNRPPSRRDAATLTEDVDDGRHAPRRGQGRRWRRRWKRCPSREPSNSGEELDTDEDEDFDFTFRRRKDRNAQEDEKWTHKQRKLRVSQNTDEVGVPAFHQQNNIDRTGDLDLGKSDSRRNATGSTPGTSTEKAQLVTGLLIGATEERTVAQRRKEQYKQELLRQIAEQQRNKIKEKRFELRVAATGVTDPEKEPNRIQHFGAINQQNDSLRWDVSQIPGTHMEDKGKGRNPRPRKEDNSAGILEQNYFNEDYHRDFSNMLGQVVIPRIAACDPPVPPILPDTHKTPYDAAYYYYGNMNPLDPNLPYSPNAVLGRSKQYQNVDISSQRPPHLRSSSRIEATHQYRASPFGVEEFPQDKSKQRRESILSYQEALRQQIKERDEQKRREKEESERYEAKMGAEMMAYNPWGKSGAGAPIKDQNGNIVSDFSQMYRHKMELLKNSGSTSGDEAKGPLSHRLSGVSDENSPQQLDVQSKYKEALTKQIEENRKKQAEEIERRRIQEEKEEKKLAQERARILQEYEEDQRKQNKIKQSHQPNEASLKNSGSTPGVESKVPLSSHKSGLSDEHSSQRLEIQLSYKEALAQQIQENKKKQAEEKERRRIQEENEEKRLVKAMLETSLNSEKNLSPPIPTLRKKTLPAESRPSSVESHSSSETNCTVSTPLYRPAPPETPQAQEGQQEVIRELSAMRRFLRKEQQQLEVQNVRRSPQETLHTPLNRNRRRPRVDVFELAHREALQAAARSPLAAATHVNKQNIREFNQLKHRDTASREEVRAMFPQPPTDPQSLDIQQQALLREQQREIRLLSRRTEHDFLNDEQGRYSHPRKKPENNVHRDSALQSETTTVDFYGGEVYEEAHQRRSTQPSAKRRDRTAPPRRHKSDELVDALGQEECDSRPEKESLQSGTGQNLKSEARGPSQQHIRRRASSKIEGQSADEEEGRCSLRSALEERSVSVDSVATELWLRPGTSEAVKRRRERADSRLQAPPL